MPAGQIEKGTVVEVGMPEDLEPDLDPAYIDCVRVLKGASLLHDTVRAAHESAIPDSAFATQEYVDELEDALHTGEELLKHPEHDTIKKDMTELDDELLGELRATVGYLAPHVGVDLSLPAPDREVTDG